MADEASKSQTTDPNAVVDNAIQNNDTADNATGTKTSPTPNVDDDDMSKPPRTTNEERAAADDAAAAERVAASTKDVVPAEYREKYAANNGTCGDFIATELSAMAKDGGIASLNAVKAENGIPAGKWADLNNGMQRMNLANTLRASYLRGEMIKIGGKEHSIGKALVEFEGEGDDREPLKYDDPKELGKFIKMVDLQDTDRTRAALIRTMSPKPEKKPTKTAEERAAEKAAKDKAREDEKAKKAEERAADKAKKDAERAAAQKARDDEKAKKEKERDEAKAKKDAERDRLAKEREAAKAEAKAAAAKASEGGKAADDAAKATQAVADKKAGDNKKAGAVK